MLLAQPQTPPFPSSLTAPPYTHLFPVFLLYTFPTASENSLVGCCGHHRSVQRPKPKVDRGENRPECARPPQSAMGKVLELVYISYLPILCLHTYLLGQSRNIIIITIYIIGDTK